jgi:hypothetical protein
MISQRGKTYKMKISQYKDIDIYVIRLEDDCFHLEITLYIHDNQQATLPYEEKFLNPILTFIINPRTAD